MKPSAQPSRGMRPQTIQASRRKKTTGSTQFIFTYDLRALMILLLILGLSKSPASLLSHSCSRLLWHIFQQIRHILSHRAWANKINEKEQKITLVASCIAIAVFFLSAKWKCREEKMVKQLSNAFRDSMPLWFSSVQRRNQRRNRCVAGKNGANHICVSWLSINLLMFDLARERERARSERQNIRFLSAKAKDIHKVVRISQQKLMPNVICILTEQLRLTPSSSSCSSSSMTERPLFYISLNIIISFFSGSGILSWGLK